MRVALTLLMLMVSHNFGILNDFDHPLWFSLWVTGVTYLTLMFEEKDKETG